MHFLRLVGALVSSSRVIILLMYVYFELAFLVCALWATFNTVSARLVLMANWLTEYIPTSTLCLMCIYMRVLVPQPRVIISLLYCSAKLAGTYGLYPVLE